MKLTIILIFSTVQLVPNRCYGQSDEGYIIDLALTTAPQEPPFNGPCHKFVSELMLKDKDERIGFPSATNTCRTKTRVESATEIQFGGSDKFIDYLSKQRFSHLGAENQPKLKTCDTKPHAKSQIATKYLYLMDRSETLQRASAAQITALDRVLGDTDTMSLLQCDKSSFPGLKKQCEEAKACGKTGSAIAAMTKRTQEKLDSIKSLQAEMKKNSMELTNLRLTGEERQAIFEKNLRLKVLVEEERAQIPWAFGSTFQRYMAVSQGSSTALERALTKQLEADRRDAVTNFQEGATVQNCLNGTAKTYSSCDSDFLTDFSKKTAQFKNGWAETPKDETKGRSATFDYEMGTESCLLEFKGQEIETVKDIKRTGVDVVLTLASAGLSSSAVIGRMLATRAGYSQQTVAKITRMSGVGGRAGQVGADGGNFAKDVNDAISICQQASVEPSNSNATNSNNLCKIDSIYTGSKEADRYNSCMFAVMQSGFPGGRLALSKVRELAMQGKLAKMDKESQERLGKFLEAQDGYSKANKAPTLNAAKDLTLPERYEAAEKLIGRKLNDTQREAIKEAHLIGDKKGYFEYTKKEIEKKAKTLQAAGFKKNEIDQIMRKGLAGNGGGHLTLEMEFDTLGLGRSAIKKEFTRDELKTYDEAFADVSKKRETGMATASRRESRLAQVEKELDDTSLPAKKRKELEDEKTKIYADRTADAQKHHKNLTQNGTDGYVQESRAKIHNATLAKQEAEERLAAVKSADPNDYKAIGEAEKGVQDQIRNRMREFQQEGHLLMKNTEAPPREAISSMRRSVKDANLLDSKGRTIKSATEAEERVALQSFAQDQDGISANTMSKLFQSQEKMDRLKNGQTIIEVKMKPINDGTGAFAEKAKTDAVWDAYTKYSQRRADQSLVRDIADGTYQDVKKASGISDTQFDQMSDEYSKRVQDAKAALEKEVKKFYGNDSAQVMKDLEH